MKTTVVLDNCPGVCKYHPLNSVILRDRQNEPRTGEDTELRDLIPFLTKLSTSDVRPMIQQWQEKYFEETNKKRNPHKDGDVIMS